MDAASNNSYQCDCPYKGICDPYSCSSSCYVAYTIQGISNETVPTGMLNCPPPAKVPKGKPERIDNDIWRQSRLKKQMIPKHHGKPHEMTQRRGYWSMR